MSIQEFELLLKDLNKYIDENFDKNESVYIKRIKDNIVKEPLNKEKPEEHLKKENKEDQEIAKLFISSGIKINTQEVFLSNPVIIIYDNNEDETFLKNLSQTIEKYLSKISLINIKKLNKESFYSLLHEEIVKLIIIPHEIIERYPYMLKNYQYQKNKDRLNNIPVILTKHNKDYSIQEKKILWKEISKYYND